MIGNPADVRCLAMYQDAVNREVTHEREVRLSELGLRPIDLITTVTASETTPQTTGTQPATAQASELDARIAFLVLGEPDAAEDGSVEIRYAPADRSRRSFAEVAEVLRTIGAMLGTSRPLEPRDLLAPDRAADAASADTLPAEATGRANGAASDLQAAAAALTTALGPLDVDPRPVAPNLTPLRDALMAAAAFGIASAVPRSRKGNRPEQVESLITQAVSVRSELNRRRDAAASLVAPLDIVRAVFGDGFAFLPRFVPVAGELDQALAVGPAPAPSGSAVRRWLHGAAQTRPPIRRWRHLTMLTRALGAPAVEPRIAQLPHRSAPWAAEPFGDDEHRPPSGIVSLALLRAAAPAVATPWVGLVVDEWTELVPNENESTALAFHYDDPGAEAPQAVLVAVPPEPTTRPGASRRSSRLSARRSSSRRSALSMASCSSAVAGAAGGLPRGESQERYDFDQPRLARRPGRGDREGGLTCRRSPTGTDLEPRPRARDLAEPGGARPRSAVVPRSPVSDGRVPRRGCGLARLRRRSYRGRRLSRAGARIGGRSIRSTARLPLEEMVETEAYTDHARHEGRARSAGGDRVRRAGTHRSGADTAPRIPDGVLDRRGSRAQPGSRRGELSESDRRPRDRRRHAVPRGRSVGAQRAATAHSAPVRDPTGRSRRRGECPRRIPCRGACALRRHRPR